MIRNCNNCLFYESSCIIVKDSSVYGVDYCHWNEGLYDEDTCKLVEPILIDDCENFRESISLAFHRIEKEYGITILFAVESGSRVWGFSNKDSDFDIRFIFKYNRLEDYLRLDKFDDTIIYNDGVYDIVGWDIGKALKLHSKSNPSLREWLLSDIVYVMDYEGVFDGLPVFDNDRLLWYYYRMCCDLWGYFEDIKVWSVEYYEMDLIKKYLYMIRCILTWQILKENTMEPKINIYDLLNIHYLMFKDDFIRETTILLLEKYKGLNDKLSSDNLNSLYEYIASNLRIMKEETPKIKTIKNEEQDIYNQRYYEIITKKIK